MGDPEIREYHLDIRAVARTEGLSLAQRQMLEVVQALLSHPKVLLLDEPTTALGHAEVDRLHEFIRTLATDGVGVVYVSHRLPEVLEVAGADHSAARRREPRHVRCFGDHRGRRRHADGRPADGRARSPSRTPKSIPNGIVGQPTRGRRFGPVDLTVRHGEIVGIAGAEGNGQVQFLRALAGVEPSNGSVVCAGRRVHLGSPPGPFRAGIVLLSADRKAESIFTALGVRANATLVVLKRFSRLGFVSRRREKQPVVTMVERLRLKSSSIEQPAQYLSGGNQQKVALLRPFLSGELT